MSPGERSRPRSPSPPPDFQRPAAFETNIAQHLGHGLESPADLARRLAKLLHHRQHLHRRDQTVAGGRIVGQNDVARLLAARR